MRRPIAMIALPLATVLFAMVLGGPFALYWADPSFEGQTPIRLQDDGAYFSRIQAALQGRVGPYENGITAPAFHLRAAGPALLERTEGTLLSWTGLTGVDVGTMVSIVCATLCLPLLTLFLRRLPLSDGVALGAAIIYVGAALGVFIRPHLAVLLPFAFLTLFLVQRIVRKPSPFLVPIAAVCLALLPALYFWIWMWTWTTCAVLFGLLWFGGDTSPARERSLRLLAQTAGLAFLLSIPTLLDTWVLQTADPAFQEMSLYRSGLYPSHAIASPIRSVLQLLLVVVAGALYFRRSSLRSSLLLPLACVGGAFIVMHQHVLHGKDFLSSSHYEPVITVAAVMMGAWALERVRSSGWCDRFVASSAALLLTVSTVLVAAAAWDYRVGWSFLGAHDVAGSMKHLAPVLRLLTDGERRTILTDARTAIEVTSRTDDDVVFTPYVQHLLVSNAAFAARGCMADLFQPGGPDIRMLAWHTLQFRGAFMLPEREAAFREICASVLRNPAAAMRQYGVDLVLWNEIERPEWDIPPGFTKLRQGHGWSLWQP